MSKTATPEAPATNLAEGITTWQTVHDELRTALHQADADCSEARALKHRAESHHVDAGAALNFAHRNGRGIEKSVEQAQARLREAGAELQEATTALQDAEARLQKATEALQSHEAHRPCVSFDALSGSSRKLRELRTDQHRVAERLVAFEAPDPGADLEAAQARMQAARDAYRDALAAEALGDADPATLKTLEADQQKALTVLEKAQAAADRAEGTQAGLRTRLETLDQQLAAETLRQQILVAEHAHGLHREAITTIEEMTAHPALRQALNQLAAASHLFSMTKISGPASDGDPKLEVRLDGRITGFPDRYIRAEESAGVQAADKIMQAAGLVS